MALERVVLSGYKYWEVGIYARAELLALERMRFILVSWRSSGSYCARACPDFVLGARAGHTYMSCPLGDFKSLLAFLSLTYYF